MGLQGLMHLRAVHRRRRRVHRARTAAPNSRLRTTSPTASPRIVRGRTPAWSDRCCAQSSSTRRARSSTAFRTISRCTATPGDTFSVSATSGGGGRGAVAEAAGAGGGRGGGPGADGRPDAARPTIPDVVQGRPASEGTNLSPLPPRRQVQPWQYAMPTEEALKRNPANVIPPQFRPRVALRFDAQDTLLVSGLLDGGARHRAAAGRGRRSGREGPRRALCQQPDLSRRDAAAATSWCSTRS